MNLKDNKTKEKKKKKKKNKKKEGKEQHQQPHEEAEEQKVIQIEEGIEGKEEEEEEIKEQHEQQPPEEKQKEKWILIEELIEELIEGQSEKETQNGDPQLDFDFGYIREGIEEEKAKWEIDGIQRHFTDEPPRPTKPLRTKDGRVPKIGVLVVSEFLSWAAAYFFTNAFPLSRYPFATLLQRIEYVMRLFEGCEVELIVCHTTIPSHCEDAFDEFAKKTGANLFDLLYVNKVYAYLLDRNQEDKFDFGLMINIRGNGVDAGMGYGLRETHERLLLRGLGLASQGNFMFGDWGRPGDVSCRDPDERTDLEYSGHYDSSGYTRPEIRRQFYGFAYPEIPVHSRPFARLVRLGRFIRPIFSNQKHLRQADIERIWSGVRGDYFSEANVWATWWCTYSGLLFARDLMYHPYHKWNYPPIQAIQKYLAGQWLEFQRFYWNSFEQEWAELLLRVMRRLKAVTVVMFWAVLVPFVLCLGYYLLEYKMDALQDDTFLLIRLSHWSFK